MLARPLFASLVLALVGSSCCASRNRQPAVIDTVCTARPELPDEIDPRTGLAPIPRFVDGDDARPSGPQYWRQMRPVKIPNIARAVKVVVAHESACAELHEGGVKCWTLPSHRFDHLPTDTEPEGLVKRLEGAEPLPEPAHRGTVPAEIARAFAAIGETAQVEVGASLACARFQTGEVSCFSTTPPRRAPSASDFAPTPAPVPELSARALSVGGSACAINEREEVVCWGFIAQTAMFPACEVRE
jgi:hypothetical protein